VLWPREPSSNRLERRRVSAAAASSYRLEL
jgi:hypothetical protein